jgi:hypothetical protein
MAKLTQRARKRLPRKSFAIPSKKTEANPAGRGAYPIPDIEHARNALARVSQHGSSAEKAQVRAKVYAKFPILRKRKKER